MSSLSFQVFSQQHEKAQLGESPCWDRECNDLWWVDLTGRLLLKTNIISGKTMVWKTPEYPGFVVMTASGCPVVGMQTGIYAFAPDAGTFEKLVKFDQPGCRFNDATVDQRGRLWASTMAVEGQRGRAEIHLITDSGSRHS